MARSVDPLLAGVYAGSAATIGLRSAVRHWRPRWTAGARSLTDAVREALARAAPPTAVGVRRRRRRLRGAGRRARPPGRASAGRRSAVEQVNRAPRGWELVDDEGQRWHADAAVLAVPAPRLPTLIDGVAPADRGRGATHRGGVHGAGGTGAAGRHPAAGAVGGAGGDAESDCAPRRLRCRAANGGGAETWNWCGCRTAGSATTSRPQRR